MATLQEVYHLSLRAAEGLTVSVVKLLGVGWSVPDDSTLCRRRRTLGVVLPRRRIGEPLHAVVDSTGIKISGEGEWKVRQYGYSKRRTWRKLHLGADEATGELVAAAVTTNNYTDGQVLPELLARALVSVRQSVAALETPVLLDARAERVVECPERARDVATLAGTPGG